MTKPYCIGSDEWNGLSKLIEELGELQQVCGKIIGSEGSTAHWSGDLNEKFIEEIGDVYASLDFFLSYNFLGKDIEAVKKQSIMKYTRFVEWDKDVRNV
jgi:hypothetical protein